MNATLDFEVYSADALRTERPLHEIVGDAQFVPAALDILVQAGKLADLLKKRLVYGREINDTEFITVLDSLRNAVSDADDVLCDGDPVQLAYNPRLLHAALGGYGEQAELIEAMQNAIDNDQDLDPIHAMEEVGDQLWYVALALDEIGILTGFTPFDVAVRNIAKLRKRFPEKFTLERVTHRDLAAERAALEGRA